MQHRLYLFGGSLLAVHSVRLARRVWGRVWVKDFVFELQEYGENEGIQDDSEIVWVFWASHAQILRRRGLPCPIRQKPTAHGWQPLVFLELPCQGGLG